MRKILVSALALVFAVAPAMAQELEKSVKVSLYDQFQMVGDLGTSSSTKIQAITHGTEKTTKSDADVYFRNRRMRFGATATYGILEVAFAVKADKDIGNPTLKVNTAEATLNFMDEVALSMGHVAYATFSYQQSSSARLGIQGLLADELADLSSMGIKLHGAVAKGLFEYALTLSHGYQPLLQNSSYTNSTVSNVVGPGVGLQLRFNLLNGETTGGSDYFLGKKSAMTLGFSFFYQKLADGAKYYKFKAATGSTADQEHLMVFDVFLKGDVALGDNSLPFKLVYQHVGMSPFVNTTLQHTDDVASISTNTSKSDFGVHLANYIGQFTYGLGFYIGSAKLMPAFKHSIEIYTINKDYLKSGGLNHQLELSLGYFPFGKNLNLKIAYLYTGKKTVFTEVTSGTVTKEDDFTKSDDHKLITQVQMKI